MLRLKLDGGVGNRLLGERGTIDDNRLGPTAGPARVFSQWALFCSPSAVGQ
jgi:hypothetical protein